MLGAFPGAQGTSVNKSLIRVAKEKESGAVSVTVRGCWVTLLKKSGQRSSIGEHTGTFPVPQAHYLYLFLFLLNCKGPFAFVPCFLSPFFLQFISSSSLTF